MTLKILFLDSMNKIFNLMKFIIGSAITSAPMAFFHSAAKLKSNITIAPEFISGATLLGSAFIYMVLLSIHLEMLFAHLLLPRALSCLDKGSYVMSLE